MVLDLLLIGLAITLEPFPLTAFILMLSAEKGTMKGLAFILGWLACLVAVIAAVVLTTGGVPPKPQTAPSTAVLAVKLTLGVALILLAVRQRRRMGLPDGACGQTRPDACPADPLQQQAVPTAGFRWWVRPSDAGIAAFRAGDARITPPL